MQIEERIITVVCSAKDCGRKEIAAGQQAFRDLCTRGWTLDETVLGTEVDLCPECTEELREWSGVAAIEDLSNGDGAPTQTNDYHEIYSDGAAPLDWKNAVEEGDLEIGDTHGDINGGLT